MTLEEKLDQLINQLSNGAFVPIVSEQTSPYGQAIKTPADAHHAFAQLFPEMKDWQQETMVLICLDNQNRPIWHGIIFVGSLKSATATPREIFRRALIEHAAAVIIAHNHPSGTATPSVYDITATRRLALAGEVLDIPLHDHTIIGREGWVSLREHNGSLFTKDPTPHR